MKKASPGKATCAIVKGLSLSLSLSLSQGVAVLATGRFGVACQGSDAAFGLGSKPRARRKLQFGT